MKTRIANSHNFIVATPAPKSIGIIGGTGRMGQRLKHEFEASGYRVITTGRSAGVSERTMKKLNSKLLREADVVVLAMPEDEIKKGLAHLFSSRSLRGLRGKFIFDICSTKTEPMHRMGR